MAEPRERPILFTGPMVRAILDGRKTQTRRVMAPQPGPDFQRELRDLYLSGRWDDRRPCPYGRLGDRLWVRETWAPTEGVADPREYACSYAADWQGEQRPGHVTRWRPSIHMPRWASRLTLEVTGVRVERLQDITQADARAEGVVDTTGAWGTVPGALSETSRAGPRGAFEALWNGINGAGAWDANPRVWVVAFRRVQS